MVKFAVALGVILLLLVAGVGLYVTDFTAYLGNDPSTCNNCHVMDSAYEGWYHAPHKLWATCSDCHTPHDLIPKYIVKAESGYHHVSAFTLGAIPLAIRAKPASKEIVQENCIRCHKDTVEDMLGGSYAESQPLERYCFECHRTVAHGERGISLLPYQQKEIDK